MALVSEARDLYAKQGKVLFGNKVIGDAEMPRVEGPNVFAAGDRMAYVAHLNDEPNATSVERLVSRVGTRGDESTVETKTQSIPDPTYRLIFSSAPRPVLRFAIRHGAGHYRMRFIANGVVLAQGDFEIVE